MFYIYQGCLKPKHTSKDVSEFAEVISLHVQYILITLEENVVHQHSKPEDYSKAPNPHRFEPPIGIAGNRKQVLTYTQEITRVKLE
jgi:hypothetical protein